MARWRRSPEVAWRVAGGALVAAVDPADVVVISAPAGAVWDQLTTSTSVAAVVDGLVSIFGASPSLDGDVRALLDDLLAHGLVEVVP